MKRLGIAALVIIAALTAYNTYRLNAIDAWLGAQVATRVEGGHEVPLNRADALAYFLIQDIMAFKAASERK